MRSKSLPLILPRQFIRPITSRGARECAGCAACCYSLGVRELGKDKETPCRHTTGPNSMERSCGIYEQRPQACQDFECLWKQGVMSDDHPRPNVSGVVLSATTQDSEFGRQIMVAYEAWPGAFQVPKVKAYLAELAKDELIMMVVGKQRGLMGPAGPLREASAFIAAKLGLQFKG